MYHGVFFFQEENIYFPLILPRTLVLDGHQCSSPNTGSSVHFRNVTVVDSRGISVKVFYAAMLQLLFLAELQTKCNMLVFNKFINKINKFIVVKFFCHCLF